MRQVNNHTAFLKKKISIGMQAGGISGGKKNVRNQFVKCSRGAQVRFARFYK